MKENIRINEQTRKASPSDVIWWDSIHRLAHRSTGRQYWVGAICGDIKSTLRLLAKKEELRMKWLDRTLPLFHIYPAPAGARRVNTERRDAFLSVFNRRAPAVVHRPPGPTTNPQGASSLALSLSLSQRRVTCMSWVRAKIRGAQ